VLCGCGEVEVDAGARGFGKLDKAPVVVGGFRYGYLEYLGTFSYGRIRDQRRLRVPKCGPGWRMG